MFWGRKEARKPGEPRLNCLPTSLAAQGVPAKGQAPLTRWSRSSLRPCRPSPSFGAAAPGSPLSSCSSWSPWRCWSGCNSGQSWSSRTARNASPCVLCETEQREKRVNVHSPPAALFVPHEMPHIPCRCPWLCVRILPRAKRNSRTNSAATPEPIQQQLQNQFSAHQPPLTPRRLTTAAAGTPTWTFYCQALFKLFTCINSQPSLAPMRMHYCSSHFIDEEAKAQWGWVNSVQVTQRTNSRARMLTPAVSVLYCNTKLPGTRLTLASQMSLAFKNHTPQTSYC